MEKIGGTVIMKKLDRENINKRYVYHFFKRAFDFLASLAGLIVLSPLFIYIAFKIHNGDYSGRQQFHQPDRILIC